MSKYKRLKEKIRNVFVGFQIDEYFDEYPYMDLDKTDKDILKDRVFGIDSFPKQMEAKSPHGVLDVFWDLDKDKTLYLRQEDKFLRALHLIMSYSNDIIILSRYHSEERKKNVEKCLTKKERKYLNVISDTIFDFNDIDYDYYAINSLMKLTLRERGDLCIYMLDLEIALDIQGLYSNVYLGLNGNIDIVKYICNIEGLYIRN